MSVFVTVNCPKCGNPVAVECKYSGGGSTDSAHCSNCGNIVHVHYYNDSFGFRIMYVR